LINAASSAARANAKLNRRLFRIQIAVIGSTPTFASNEIRHRHEDAGLRRRDVAGAPRD
jgi:hypothetical protein